jgi:hypothetical protein
MKYRRKADEVDAMQMPMEPDMTDVEAIVDWVTPGIVKYVDDPDWPGWGLTEITDWSTRFIYFNNEMARPGEFIVKDRGSVLVMTANEFNRKYEEV